MRRIVVVLAAMALALTGLSAGAQDQPPGGQIVFTFNVDGTYDIGMVSADGGPRETLVDLADNALAPRVSADGTAVLFQAHDADGDWELYAAGTTPGTTPVQLTSNTYSDGFPTWGADAMTLISASDPDDNNNPEIVRTDIASGAQTRLTTNPAIDSAPSQAPDGRIVFWSDRAGHDNIWLMDAGGSNPVNLTPGSGRDKAPVFSPDGARIAFQSDRTGDWEVFVMDADGGNQVNLTQNPAADGAPAWSPDGTWIVFNSTRLTDGSERDIFAGPATDLTDPSIVVASIADEYDPSWGPLPEDPAPSPTPTPTPPAELETIRLSGDDRIATAVAIADHAWDSRRHTVVLARGDDFPDALAGGALAVQSSGPMLLTNRSSLHPVTEDALRRLTASVAQPPLVYLLGGTAALSEQVEQDVLDMGFDVQRLAGPTRFDTAVTIAQLGVQPGTVFVADGGDFPAALVAGAAAAEDGGVVVLTSGTTMPAATQDYLDARAGSTRLVAVGGAAATALAGTRVEVIDGANPWALSVAAARWVYGTRPSSVALASGVAFPDGLTGGAHARWFDGPLLLVQPDTMPDEVAQYLSETADVQRLIVYGGPAAISDAVVEAAQELLNQTRAG